MPLARRGVDANEQVSLQLAPGQQLLIIILTAALAGVSLKLDGRIGLGLERSGSTRAQVGSFRQQVLHPRHARWVSGRTRKEAGSWADGTGPSSHAGGLSGRRDFRAGFKGDDWNVKESEGVLAENRSEDR